MKSINFSFILYLSVALDSTTMRQNKEMADAIEGRKHNLPVHLTPTPRPCSF